MKQTARSPMCETQRFHIKKFKTERLAGYGNCIKTQFDCIMGCITGIKDLLCGAAAACEKAAVL